MIFCNVEYQVWTFVIIFFKFQRLNFLRCFDCLERFVSLRGPTSRGHERLRPSELLKESLKRNFFVILDSLQLSLREVEISSSYGVVLKKVEKFILDVWRINLISHKLRCKEESRE